jgi:uncharacterized membrane protein YphA (DoxX/SURF4 family)
MVSISKITRWAALAGGAACIAAAAIVSTYTGNGQPVFPSAYFAEGLFSGAGLVLVCTFLGTIRRAN